MFPAFVGLAATSTLSLAWIITDRPPIQRWTPAALMMFSSNGMMFPPDDRRSRFVDFRVFGRRSQPSSSLSRYAATHLIRHSPKQLPHPARPTVVARPKYVCRASRLARGSSAVPNCQISIPSSQLLAGPEKY
jgi:hypothetical protein